MYTKFFPQLYKFCMVVQFFKHFPCGRWHLLMGSSFESNLPQQFGRPGSRVESVDLVGIQSPHFAISLWDLEISWSFYTVRIHFQVAIHSRERFVLSSLVLHLLYIVDLPWLTTLETCICSLASNALTWELSVRCFGRILASCQRRWFKRQFSEILGWVFLPDTFRSLHSIPLLYISWR